MPEETFDLAKVLGLTEEQVDETIDNIGRLYSETKMLSDFVEALGKKYDGVSVFAGLLACERLNVLDQKEN